MGRKLKIFLILTPLIILLIMVSVIYMGFYGNPIKLSRVKSDARRYIDEHYSTVQIESIKPWFSFKSNSYGATITTDEEEPLQFNIEFYRSNKVYEGYVEAKLEREIKTIAKDVLNEKLPDSLLIRPSVYINDQVADDFKEDTTYSKDLPINIRLDVRWYDDTITKEKFAGDITEVISLLYEEGLNVVDYFFSCKFNDNYSSYMASLGKQELAMSKEELLNSESIHLYEEQH